MLLRGLFDPLRLVPAALAQRLAPHPLRETQCFFAGRIASVFAPTIVGVDELPLARAVPATTSANGSSAAATSAGVE